MKLDMPHFDGFDPLGWIFKINQFFEYHNTPDHERLTIASFYTDDRALAWFQWIANNDQLTSRPIFLHALQTYFLPSQYEKSSVANKVYLMGRLFNLKMGEGNSITDHINEFNTILAQLESVQIKLEDKVKALILLSSLPDS
ncbi:Retrovirus-related Pol polyprotein from transposon TNT 1-94 [Glycine soja]